MMILTTEWLDAVVGTDPHRDGMTAAITHRHCLRFLLENHRYSTWLSTPSGSRCTDSVEGWLRIDARGNRKIGDIIDLGNETDRFSEAYRGDYDGELNYVTYEWQTTPNRVIQLTSPSLPSAF